MFLYTWGKIVYINKINFNNSTNFNSTNFQAKKIKINGRKFVPLNRYNKPLLELTEEDKAKIEKLEKQISTLQAYINHKHSSTRYVDFGVDTRRKLNTQIMVHQELIKELQDKVRKIKKSRYQKQLSEIV